MPRSHTISPRGALGLAVLFAAAACEPASEPKVWPAGTVLALDGLPIAADEVDASADVIAQLEPDNVTAQARRLALTNVVLPRAAGILVAGEKRETARRRAVEIRAALAGGANPDGPFEPAVMQAREGVANDIGFETWAFASQAADGEWSQPLETIGAFEIARVDERSMAGAPRQVRYKLRVWVVPYIDDPNLKGVIDARLDRSKLTYVDHAWAEFVPEWWKHRLRAGVP
jgi:hypothetical protein